MSGGGRGIQSQNPALAEGARTGHPGFFPRASPAEAEEFVSANRSAETMAEFQGLLLGLDQERPGDLMEREFLGAIREE